MINNSGKMTKTISAEARINEIKKKFEDLINNQVQYEFNFDRLPDIADKPSKEQQEWKKKLSKKMYAKWGHISNPPIIRKKPRIT